MIAAPLSLPHLPSGSFMALLWQTSENPRLRDRPKVRSGWRAGYHSVADDEEIGEGAIVKQKREEVACQSVDYEMVSDGASGAPSLRTSWKANARSELGPPSRRRDRAEDSSASLVARKCRFHPTYLRCPEARSPSQEGLRVS